MKTNGNHKAFTSPDQPKNQSELDHSGLTKREYFAAIAPVRELVCLYYDQNYGSAEQYAKVAVQYSDALIAELNKEQK